MDGTSVKSERLLQIYSRLVSGDVLPKKELAHQFHVTERSIQRDMESLRYFFAEQGLRQDIQSTTAIWLQPMRPSRFGTTLTQSPQIVKKSFERWYASRNSDGRCSMQSL